ncbi:MAG: PD-(D/E)XK nuclease family protein [Dysgonamonadaceae bacterium]|jgi:hypothetical protein|nr:PD-(D/E)XK nuclease family protein [Dysgonamonadaceae bacterium]
MKREDSKFMKWGQYNEATIAHFVAWTLKCSTKEGKKTYGGRLSNYSKNILLFLLFGKKVLKDSDNYLVSDVKVRREWKHIDILAEIILNGNKKYVLCIELQNYSHTNENQLKSCKPAFDGYYENKDFQGKFVLLGVWKGAVPEIDKSLCKQYGFRALTFQDILDEVFLKNEGTFESSDNQLFDEFWTGRW